LIIVHTTTFISSTKIAWMYIFYLARISLPRIMMICFYFNKRSRNNLVPRRRLLTFRKFKIISIERYNILNISTTVPGFAT
jgi:hypothetical protein